MARRWTPQPRERFARQYRGAQRARDLETPGRYERAGFGEPAGYHGAYADRPTYAMRRGELYPPGPAGSGWPHALHHVPSRVEARHRRALRDRELARSVDAALYDVLDPVQADHISVYADEGEITLAGPVDSTETAWVAIETAWDVPGVRGVRDVLVRPRRRGRGRGRFGAGATAGWSY